MTSEHLDQAKPNNSRKQLMLMLVIMVVFRRWAAR